jgi:hypothetical protein
VKSNQENVELQDPETRVLNHLVARLRKTKERGELLEAAQTTNEAVERLLMSPRVLEGVAAAQNAFLIEHWPDLLKELFSAAQKKESWAWRILLDVAGISAQLRAACGSPGPSDAPPLEDTDEDAATPGFAEPAA